MVVFFFEMGNLGGGEVGGKIRIVFWVVLSFRYLRGIVRRRRVG